MDLTFWGVRGAVAAPGPEYNRYGGNTTCLEVRGASGALLIIDAGTGVIGLGNRLLGEGFGAGDGEATLLLSHTHWDHIQGFPFFVPAYIPGNRITMYGPMESPAALEGVMEGQMDPHFSPVHSLSNLGAGIRFEGFCPGTELEIGGVKVTGELLPHGRCSSLAYRLEERGRVLVVATDVLFTHGEPDAQGRAIFQGAHCLVHDCTFTPEDLTARRSRGNASIAEAARAAAQAGAERLVMTHYDQDYTDEDVDALAGHCRALLDAEPGGADVELVAAREGLTLKV